MRQNENVKPFSSLERKEIVALFKTRDGRTVRNRRFHCGGTQWALETLDVDWYRHALGRANQSRQVLGIRQEIWPLILRERLLT